MDNALPLRVVIRETGRIKQLQEGNLRPDTDIRLNKPHVVYDTIDGETILVNLKSGNYYSVVKTGLLICEVIVNRGDFNDYIDKTSKKFNVTADKVRSDVEAFIEKLLEESLAVNGMDEQADITPWLAEDIEQKLGELKGEYEVPVLNKYSDMQDMLLLDPIHDTDELGWPSPKDDDNL